MERLFHGALFPLSRANQCRPGSPLARRPPAMHACRPGVPPVSSPRPGRCRCPPPRRGASGSGTSGRRVHGPAGGRRGHRPPPAGLRRPSEGDAQRSTLMWPLHLVMVLEGIAQQVQQQQAARRAVDTGVRQGLPPPRRKALGAPRLSQTSCSRSGSPASAGPRVPAAARPRIGEQVIQHAVHPGDPVQHQVEVLAVLIAHMVAQIVGQPVGQIADGAQGGLQIMGGHIGKLL